MRRGLLRRPATALVAAALAAAAGACGVPAEDGATRHGPDEVPFNLLVDDPPTTTTTPLSRSEAVTVYFVAGSQLVATTRPLSDPAPLFGVVAVMAAGPTPAEAVLGVRSAIPGPDAVRQVGAAGGTAGVDLTAGFRVIPPGDQVLALAQIVYTLTARPGIGRVAFTLDGQEIDVPRGDGSLTRESVAREDYAVVAPAMAPSG